MKTVTDYQGRQIRLTDERWQHIIQHPEMADMDGAIIKALTQPKLVSLSNTDATVRLYYRYCKNTVVGDKWLCVVVKSLSEDAFIITAYLTDQPKKGEQIWPKP